MVCDRMLCFDGVTTTAFALNRAVGIPIAIMRPSHAQHHADAASQLAECVALLHRPEGLAVTTLLVKNVSHLATFDRADREIKDGAVLVRDNVIERIGTMAEMADVLPTGRSTLAGHLVMPGLVNTHHHMYQNLTRVMVQDDELFVWLRDALSHLGAARR